MPAKKPSSRRHQPKGVVIIHEDRDILVVEKPPGLLTVSTDRVRSETLYYKLTDYVRKGNAKSRERVFIVHRLTHFQPHAPFEVGSRLVAIACPSRPNTLWPQNARVRIDGSIKRPIGKDFRFSAKIVTIYCVEKPSMPSKSLT